MRCYVIFNPKSGAALSLGLTAETLQAAFAKANLDAEIDAEGSELAAKVERALASDVHTIVSAGGDGTATAIAARLVGTPKCLAVLPLGTANLLARDLGVPLAIETAIGSLTRMVPVEIDAGEVNGHLFLHKAVVGVIPAIAAAREKVRGRGVWNLLAFVRYLIRRLDHARRSAVAITSRDTQDRIERVQAIAVANNAYDQGWGKVFCRSRLTDGTLTLYVLRRLTFRDALRLAMEMIVGTWQEDAAISIETVRSVTLSSKRKRVSVMIDGEVTLLESPLQFRIRPKVLRVLAAPVQATNVETAGT